jgi:hypothetical protein
MAVAGRRGCSHCGRRHAAPTELDGLAATADYKPGAPDGAFGDAGSASAGTVPVANVGAVADPYQKPITIRSRRADFSPQQGRNADALVALAAD